MSITLVDTNVILDIIKEDPRWEAWSSSNLEACGNLGMVAVNPLIYAELSSAFDSVEALNAALAPNFIQLLDLPWDAAFLAGQAYKAYRRQGGTKTSPIADFYIGAHAAVKGFTLLTRDTRRYKTYFPALKVIAPNEKD